MAKASPSRRTLLERERTLGQAADLLLGMQRWIAAAGPTDRAFVDRALESLRRMASRGALPIRRARSFPALVSRSSAELFRSPDAALDVLVQAVDEVSEARVDACARLAAE